MMATCPICGTRRVIYWPEHWVYRRGETYYCSEDCMIVDQTKDMKLIKMIAHVRAKKGENSMARYKKDGTPARKPGPKKKTETPEKITIKADDVVGKIANAETPESVKIKQTVQSKFVNPAYIEGFEVVGIKGQFGTYKANAEVNYFDFQPFGGELCMSPEDWREQLKEIDHAMKILGVKL